MSGKSTVGSSKHASRNGAWGCSIELGVYDWNAIEKAIGCLSVKAREEIQDLIDMMASMAGETTVSLTDVRATLSKMSGMQSEAELIRAFENCDSTSRALIDRALYFMDGPEFWRNNPLPAKIKAAAWTALNDLQKSRGGANAKVWRRHLARRVIAICEAREISTSISHGETISPAVALLKALLDVVEHKSPNDASSAAKLLSEVRSK